MFRRVAYALIALAVAGALSGARASIVITVDKSAQRMTVEVDGEQRWVWPVSTGRSGYSTPSGSFTAFRMEEDHYSKEWDDAPMPHSIFFTKKGHAIHGTFDQKRLGTPASHGCVRLSTAHAATLFALVKRRGVTTTKVVLLGQEPAAAPAMVRRQNTARTGRSRARLPGAASAGRDVSRAVRIHAAGLLLSAGRAAARVHTAWIWTAGLSGVSPGAVPALGDGVTIGEVEGVAYAERECSTRACDFGLGPTSDPRSAETVPDQRMHRSRHTLIASTASGTSTGTPRRPLPSSASNTRGPAARRGTSR